MYLFEAMLSQYANAALKNLLSGAENVTGYWFIHSLCFCPSSVPESGTLAGMS